MSDDGLRADAELALQEQTVRLVCRARDGDQYAFGDLYRLYANLVMHYLIRLLPTRSDAEEILQETFLKAWKSLGKLTQPERFKAWLLTIARNKALGASRA